MISIIKQQQQQKENTWLNTQMQYTQNPQEIYHKRQNEREIDNSASCCSPLFLASGLIFLRGSLVPLASALAEIMATGSGHSACSSVMGGMEIESDVAKMIVESW